MDQVDNPQPKDALAQFAWPERFAPYAESYAGDGLRMETPAEIAARIQKIKGIKYFPIEGKTEMSNREIRERVAYNARTRVFAFDQQGRVGALWLAEQTESGLSPKSLENPPLLQSPTGKTLRIEYVYDDDGRVAAKRIIKDSTPGAYDGEVYAIETYSYLPVRNYDYTRYYAGGHVKEPGLAIGRWVNVFHRDCETAQSTEDFFVISRESFNKRGDKVDAHLWGDESAQYGDFASPRSLNIYLIRLGQIYNPTAPALSRQ